MKKSAKVCLCILTVAVLAIGIAAICFFSSTVSASGCVDYCRRNTDSGANDFFALGDETDGDKYAYYIAADVESGKSQELFVFKSTYLGRYKFLAKSQQGDTVDGGEKVGLLKILSGDKHKSETMIFFGSTADAKISRCEYTLALADGEGKFTREKPLTDNGGNVWLIGFYGLSNYDSRTAKDITSARFFDENGNLVATYSK